MRSAAKDILTLGEEILSKEPSLLELEGPITLCGSILGDLPHLQSIWMAHADGGLLFLGDYQKDSDSGAHDVEARRDFNHRCTFESLIAWVWVSLQPLFMCTDGFWTGQCALVSDWKYVMWHVPASWAICLTGVDSTAFAEDQVTGRSCIEHQLQPSTPWLPWFFWCFCGWFFFWPSSFHGCPISLVLQATFQASRSHLAAAWSPWTP